MPIPRRSLTYQKARRLVRDFRLKGAGLETQADWQAFVREQRPTLEALAVPCRPDVRYKKDGTWKTWRHFLSQRGRRTPKLQTFASYEEWRNWLLLQGFRSKVSYEVWCRSHKDERASLRFPSNPALTYRDFPGWRAVFQKSADAAGSVARHYTPWKAARAIIREIAKTEELRSAFQFQHWAKLNRDRLGTHNIPASPDRCQQYHDDWRGWSDFLGTDTKPALNRKR